MLSGAFPTRLELVRKRDVYAGGSLRSPFLPGFSMSVEEALGA